jgi:hypothetical protein
MFEDYYMPQFDADYFNSPAFQQAIADAIGQYFPPVAEQTYYAPPPEPAPTYDASINDIPQFMAEDYGLIGAITDRFNTPQISAEQLAAERYAADQAAQQVEAQRAAAERYAAEQAAAEQAAAAEAQRVAAAQELAVRAEAERVAAERAAAAEAAAQRQQTELNQRLAQEAQAAAERAAQERALAEQAAAQAAAQAQAQAEVAAAVAPAPEPIFTPAAEPATVEAAPLAGPLAAPVETAAPLAAPLAGPLAAPVETAAPAAEQQPLPAVQPMTQEVAPFDLSSLAGLDLSGLNNLYGMNFVSDFGGGAMGGIYPNDPNLQYINAPISNKGNPTSPTGNVFTMTPDQKVRLVDLRTNEVVFEGTGYDAAREATRLGQNLTDTLGRKAEYNIQTANPAGEYTTVANEKKNKSTLGSIADVALPVIGGVLAGPLGAAAGSAASSVAQGRSLENTLLRAGLSAGTTALGGQVFGPASSAAGSAAGGAAGTAAGTTAGSALGSAAGDIVVNAARSVVPSLLGSAVGSTVGSVVPSLISTPPSAPTQPPVDDTIVVSAAPPVSGSGLPFGAAVPVPIEALLSGVLAAAPPTPAEQPTAAQPEEIVVTGTRPTEVDLGGVLGALTPTIIPPTPTTAAPEEIVVTGAETPVIPTEALAAVPIAGGLLAATGGGASNVVNGIDQATGDIVVDAPQAVAPPPPIAGFETAIPAITGGALTAAQTGGAQPSTKDGVLGTGLNISQLLSIAGISADLLKNLLGGGGGTGTATPYVSPFGTGVGIGAGRDMRANPNIIDYERYGFGPEAMFFQPGYGLLGSTGASAPQAPPIMMAPQAQPAMTINPAYMPLI